ncbi:F0F1 ATP synthase subunit alpha [Butyrivibrio sp. MC2013]|uniref:F0F1 ATP synthase subunit alpha n=1 Tax=Butyrivibrio sp. MC2013 TaxID=1280686 RepID=UPI00042A5A75|nr:F0F1 ATP synthase subunit alpha [Butyrivibrio sp. MC2013]
MANNETQTLSALVRYAGTAPGESQLEGIEKVLKKQLGLSDVEIILQKDDSIGGGFIIQCGNYEFDWSDLGRAAQLRAGINISHRTDISESDSIVSMIKEQVSKFDVDMSGREVGNVSWVGDGIAHIKGIKKAFYGEILTFEDGSKGMVQDIKRDHIGAILFDSDENIMQSTKVIRTYKEAGVPVGDALIGRVVNALGEPIDGKGPIKAEDYYPVEESAPQIIDRSPVNRPMETGILSIDTMFPIGRGQRELIIGDRQTGKTSIATDAILNQKGKDMICIYVAIGQKASTVAHLINTFREKGALDYTIVVASTASDPAPLLYIAPYAGTAIGEYFMNRGDDVLIVYDDLSKHAQAYRSISLLLERSPGREAYPGDVFYLHSRLLERSARLSMEKGGGSMTALPIIETQSGDVSAYIPTNVISITDGQIFLEQDLFAEGQRPAVNVGLSVSRVGSSAQTQAMKKASGSIRIDLAQYREMAVFTQFSSDLDDATKKLLKHGRILMELLKQPLSHPMSMHDQVLTLVAANAGRFDNVKVSRVRQLLADMLAYFEAREKDIVNELEAAKMLPDELREEILKACDNFLDGAGDVFEEG